VNAIEKNEVNPGRGARSHSDTLQPLRAYQRINNLELYKFVFGITAALAAVGDVSGPALDPRGQLPHKNAPIPGLGLTTRKGKCVAEFLFTSESVSEGHPDKVCDRISDAVVDAYVRAFPEARVACETLTTTNRIVIAGETKGPAEILTQVEDIARNVVRDIGYEQEGFHHAKARVDVLLHAQSADIAMGVDKDGAGDQGIMFGFACDETPELMPAPILYAHKILRFMAEARHRGDAPLLGPDSKSQVTLLYRDGKPVGCDNIVVSTQHVEGAHGDDVRAVAMKYVEQVIPEEWVPPADRIFVNPTGKFVVGGPDGDAGLTGRKIIVDTYGGAAPHGGGAFSGKDPTKVDRSAAYAARYLAKNVVAAGLAKRCTIQLAYAIGVAQPLAVYVETHGTGKVPEDRLGEILKKSLDLSPRGIRTQLGLDKPIYERTATYGHFGREPEADGGFAWERTDLVDLLQREA
jgi:S-adenosylmethionine synthetase